MTTDRFGGLRALLQNPPSDWLWRALLNELELWDADERERVALPYVLDHLDRWPVEIERGAHLHSATPWLRRLANKWCVSSAEAAQALVESGCAGRMVTLSVSDFFQSAEELARLIERLTGLVRVKVSTDDGRTLVTLMAARWPASLRELSVSFDLDAPQVWARRGAAALAQNETLAGLETLGLCRLKLGDAGVSALASSPHLRALHTLGIRSCELGPAGARTLADSPLLDTVERLDVGYNPLGMGLVALVSSPHTRWLRALDLDGVEISATCVRALARAPWPPLLEALELDVNALAPPALTALADVPGLRALRSLYLRAPANAASVARLLGSVHLSGVRHLSVYGELDDVWEVMCHNPALAAVERLDIDCAGLEAAQLEQLADSPMRPGLRALRIMCAQEVDAAVLGERTAWPALRELGLCGQEGDDEQGSQPALSDAGVEKLVESGLLARLEVLELYGNALSDVAALALARSGQLGQLRWLELTNNQIGDVGLCALLEPGVLRDIEALGIASNQIGDVGATALAHSHHLRALTPHFKDGSLTNNKIGLAGTLALLRSPYLNPEESLDLIGNPLTHADIVALAGEPDLARLRGLLWAVPHDAPAEIWQALLDSPYTNQKTRDNAARNIERLRGRQQR